MRNRGRTPNSPFPLGIGNDIAPPGDHVHDGTTSRKISYANLENPPRLPYRTKWRRDSGSPQSIPTGGATVTFTSATEYNTSGGVIAYNAGSITINADMCISVKALIEWAADATSQRRVQIRKNGTALAGQTLHSSLGGTSMMFTSWEGLVVNGDIITVWAFQNTGVNLNMNEAWVAIREIF